MNKVLYLIMQLFTVVIIIMLRGIILFNQGINIILNGIMVSYILHLRANAQITVLQ